MVALWQIVDYTGSVICTSNPTLLLFHFAVIGSLELLNEK